jgi:hypothetical protein
VIIIIKFFVQITDNFKKMRHSAVACKLEFILYLRFRGTPQPKGAEFNNYRVGGYVGSNPQIKSLFGDTKGKL